MTANAMSTPTAILEHAAAATLQGTTRFRGNPVDEERRLSTSKLFAGWAGDDFPSWEQAVGASVTHLSRGDGQVTNVSQEAGIIAVHVQYARDTHSHALWEFRTELTHMTLPAGLARADLIPRAKARRLRQEREKRAEHAALQTDRRRRNTSATNAR